MSVDIYLEIESSINDTEDIKIPVKENGGIIYISREEWEKRFPGREPVTVSNENKHVFEGTIPASLDKMAKAANIHDAIWNPAKIGITHAHMITPILETAIQNLKSEPLKYKAYNPTNKSGDYESFIKFISQYIRACKKNPGAKIQVYC